MLSGGSKIIFISITYKYNLEEEWYKFRDEAIKQIVIEWCEDNEINYIEE